MGISIAQQTTVFLYSVLFGAGISILYDFFRVIRKRIRHLNFVVMIEDVLFWLLAAAALFVFVYNMNSGELRAFLIIGAAIGGFLYFAILSRFVLKFFGAVFFVTEKILYAVLRPFVLLSRPLASHAGSAVKRTGIFMGKFKNLFKFKAKSAILLLGVRRRKKHLPKDKK